MFKIRFTVVLKYITSKYTLEKTKGESIMDNPENLTTMGTQDTRQRQTKQKTQHIMCWTPL